LKGGVDAGAQAIEERPTSPSPAVTTTPPERKEDVPVPAEFNRDELLTLFKKGLAELMSWLPPTERKTRKYAPLILFVDTLEKRFGTILKAVDGFISVSPGDKALLEQRIQLLKDLKWDLWTQHFRAWLVVQFPKNYTLF